MGDAKKYIWGVRIKKGTKIANALPSKGKKVKK